jgi:hypothetical protein
MISKSDVRSADQITSFENPIAALSVSLDDSFQLPSADPPRDLECYNIARLPGPQGRRHWPPDARDARGDRGRMGAEKICARLEEEKLIRISARPTAIQEYS